MDGRRGDLEGGGLGPEVSPQVRRERDGGIPTAARPPRGQVMSEYVWPGVAVIGMVLLFIRTRPTESVVDASVELQKALRLNQIEDDLASLKKQPETNPKA